MACMPRLLNCADLPVFITQMSTAKNWWHLLEIYSIPGALHCLHGCLQQSYEGGSFTLFFHRWVNPEREVTCAGSCSQQLVGVELGFTPGLGDPAAHVLTLAVLLPVLCIFIKYS